MLADAAVKLGGWDRDDIFCEVALGTLGASGDIARKRIDMYFVDRTEKQVVAVELKCSANLAEVIADANAKYAPFLSRGEPASFASDTDDRTGSSTTW